MKQQNEPSNRQAQSLPYFLALLLVVVGAALISGPLTPTPPQSGHTQLPAPWQRRQRLVTSQSVLYSARSTPSSPLSFWAAWRTGFRLPAEAPSGSVPRPLHAGQLQAPAPRQVRHVALPRSMEDAALLSSLSARFWRDGRACARTERSGVAGGAANGKARRVRTVASNALRLSPAPFVQAPVRAACIARYGDANGMRTGVLSKAGQIFRE